MTVNTANWATEPQSPGLRYQSNCRILTLSNELNQEADVQIDIYYVYGSLIINDVPLIRKVIVK
jgi:hypothetical protein